MTQRWHAAIITICISSMLLCGCGKKDDSSDQSSTTGQSSAPQAAGQTPAQSPALAQSAANAQEDQQSSTQVSQSKDVVAVAPDTLKGLLPELLAQMKRTSASGEQNRLGGADVTTAEGQYEGTDGATLELIITDMGSMTGALRIGMTAWTAVSYDHKTDTGYEKTTTYHGHKGMEEYNTENKYGAIRVVVADRFLVELEGENITMDTLGKALDQIDLQKLATLASGS